MRLTEDKVKAWLKKKALPVPDGAVASNAADAISTANHLGPLVAVKALIPIGRRGKAGAVHLVKNAQEAGNVTTRLIGQKINHFRVSNVYIEKQFPIEEEYYLSFTFGSQNPKILVCRRGGVDIEQTFEEDPDSIISQSIDPLKGLTPWSAIGLWERTGLKGKILSNLGHLTVQIYRAFCDADANMIECNPIAADSDGGLSIVGAMMEIDENALFRHPEWASEGTGFGAEGRILNEREITVMTANKALPGGALRYTELDGNIGVLMGGGGASLLQHDMVAELGGQLANHTDMSPARSIEKPLAVINAILMNPNTRSLLLSFNYLQLLPCTILVGALCEALKQHSIDTKLFPIVIRVFGPNETEARKMIEKFPGVTYMAPGASLDDAVKLIVDMTKELVQEKNVK